ncbi:Transcription repressor OFP7 [Sesamum alatum]|uniref:Transcription repressor OFP7 n=1 Tax=Sesamum alatum TaxID=300844 RepID=A0AAE1XS74_9LAMI|nr:Transcription repressor OFP7 [Sesamum alatum]
MAKRFKLRICRVITTTLQSCRSKDPSILPEDPIPSFSRPSPNHQNPAAHRPSFNHRLSSAFISFGAACGLPQTPDDHLNGTESQEFKWQKEDKWHVVAKIYEPPTPPENLQLLRRRPVTHSSHAPNSAAVSRGDKEKTREKEEEEQRPGQAPREQYLVRRQRMVQQ